MLFQTEPYASGTQMLRLAKPEGGDYSMREVLTLWDQSSDFQDAYGKFLAELAEGAIFWEHPPLMQDSLDQPYQCALVNSGALARVSANPSPFRDFFGTNEEVVSFLNLRKDARLVVPAPQVGYAYPHLLAFLRTAPQSQQRAFWQQVSRSTFDRLSETPMWLSTSGLGVYWLHVRLDSRPKYYQHRPFKSYE